MGVTGKAYLQNSERFVQLGEEKVPHLWPVYEPKRELLKSPRFQVSKLLVGNGIRNHSGRIQLRLEVSHP